MNWISVENRLPTSNLSDSSCCATQYLVYGETFCVDACVIWFASYDHTTKEWTLFQAKDSQQEIQVPYTTYGNGYPFHALDITHWMEIFDAFPKEIIIGPATRKVPASMRDLKAKKESK